MQPAVVIGLIAQFTGYALQDDIAMAARRMQQLGNDILNPDPKEAAMVQKRLLCPERVRKIPKQFSWIDQRLVRERHIERLSHRTAAFTCFWSPWPTPGA